MRSIINVTFILFLSLSVCQGQNSEYSNTDRGLGVSLKALGGTVLGGLSVDYFLTNGINIDLYLPLYPEFNIGRSIGGGLSFYPFNQVSKGKRFKNYYLGINLLRKNDEPYRNELYVAVGRNFIFQKYGMFASFDLGIIRFLENKLLNDNGFDEIPFIPFISARLGYRFKTNF